MSKLLYTLKVIDENTEELVGIIFAYSMESLEEQINKIENAIKIWQDKQKQEEAGLGIDEPADEDLKEEIKEKDAPLNFGSDLSEEEITREEKENNIDGDYDESHNILEHQWEEKNDDK